MRKSLYWAFTWTGRIVYTLAKALEQLLKKIDRLADYFSGQ